MEFQEISDELIKLVKHTGLEGDETLYVTFCPMAHKGQGGAWLQQDKAVANPYYGKMMLKCGSVKEELHASK